VKNPPTTINKLEPSAITTKQNGFDCLYWNEHCTKKNRNDSKATDVRIHTTCML
jgi:hypothetical protein